MSELAAQASLTPSGLTRSVDRLAGAGPGGPAGLPRGPPGGIRRADPGRSGDDGPGHPRPHGPRRRGAEQPLLRRRRRRRWPPCSASSATTSSTTNSEFGLDPPRTPTPAPGPTSSTSAPPAVGGPSTTRIECGRIARSEESQRGGPHPGVVEVALRRRDRRGIPTIGSIHSQRVRAAVRPRPGGQRRTDLGRRRPWCPAPNRCPGGSAPRRRPAGRPRTRGRDRPGGGPAR